MGTKISVTLDGKKVDLEDAFDVFERVFDDVDKAFEHMEETFGAFDSQIDKKVNALKKRIASKRSDEFDYIPDPGEEMDHVSYDWDPEEVVHAERRKFQRQMVHLMLITGAIGILISFGVLFHSIVTNSTKEIKTNTPPPMSQIGETTESKGMGKL